MSQQNPAKRLNIDPLTTFCFTLEITGLGITQGQAFFRGVGGLKSESEIVPYKEGGLNLTTHQLVGPSKWPNIVLKRGFTGDNKLYNWRSSFLDDNSGRKLTRHNGRIIQLGSDMKPVCSWHFLRGWPCKWEGPDYDASKSELAIETLEIAHEGLYMEQAGGAGGRT